MAQDLIVFRTKDLEFKRNLLKAVESLFKKGWATIFEYYNVRSEVVNAEYQLSNAKQQLQLVKVTFVVGPLNDREAVTKSIVNLQTAKGGVLVGSRDLDRTKVVAPIDGIAGKVSVVPGEVALTNTVLMQILQLDPIHIRMDLPQERTDDVELGQKAEVVLDSFPKETFTGTVTRVTGQVDPTMRVLSILIRIDNPEYRIKAGVSGFVRLRKARKALTVPSTALMDDGSKAMVFRVEQGRARIREIQTGRTLENGLVEVREGLDPGDEVVIFSNFYKNMTGLASNAGFLKDNDPVDANWRRWSQRD
jgi:RND family efflux transporter MFP subunit